MPEVPGNDCPGSTLLSLINFPLTEGAYKTWQEICNGLWNHSNIHLFLDQLEIRSSKLNRGSCRHNPDFLYSLWGSFLDGKNYLTESKRKKTYLQGVERHAATSDSSIYIKISHLHTLPNKSFKSSCCHTFSASGSALPFL